MATNKSELEEELKAKRICRFCLSQMSEKLSSIYSRGAANVNSKVPLPVQVMACVSIEVFSNDGMPTWICNDCRMLFEHGYRFKQMCKHAETQLRQFPLTGEWPVPLAKPRIPQMLLPTQTITKLPITLIEASTPIATAAETQAAAPGKVQLLKQIPTAQFRKSMQLQKLTKLPQQQHNETVPKKILNSNPVSSPEPPVPVRMKREYLDEETTLFLTKVDNEEELSIDDVQRLIAATNDDEVMISTTPSPKKQPKVLNKYSMRILNKDAEVVNEPRLSKPQVKRDEDGNMAIVTEILDPNDPYETEPDPIKNATPVETNVFPCPHCERSFPLRQLREIHMVNHNRERSFQCAECDKSFFSKYDLQKHTLVHTGDKPFKCTVCGKAFTRGTLLHRHEKTHTDIPKYICIFCEKPFISKEEMEKHSERHRKNRPFQCKVCRKSFAFKQGLDRHEVIHSRIQPYPCQYCDQSFSTPSKLARHLTAHAGKRPYPCKFCSKSYLLSHHLSRHLRSHNEGISQFACNDCKKVYNSRDELIFHSAVHATETLCCPLCKDLLADMDMVTDHIKAHAESESHACEFCDLIFISAESLQDHTNINHADELIPYYEDDMAQERNTKQKTDAWQEETLEELLIVDLPAGRVHLTADGTIKLEKDDKNPLSERPPSEPEEIDIDVIEDVESIAFSEPAKKVRRTCSSISADVITERATEKVKEPGQQSNRKVATAAVQQPIVTATPTAPKTKIKIEENKIISPPNTSAINSALKALPKSVSVRKSSPAATATAATVKSSSLELIPQKAVTEPIASPQKRVLRTSKRLENSTDKASVSDESSGHTQLLSFKHLTSTGGTDHTTDAANVTPQTGTSGEKVVKMMIGDKKVKVHKITISRAEADAMAKDGRIRIKDGNMILTQAQATTSSK